MAGLTLLSHRIDVLDEPVVVLPWGGAVSASYLAQVGWNEVRGRVVIQRLIPPLRQHRGVNTPFLVYELRDLGDGIYKAHTPYGDAYIEVASHSVVRVTEDVESAKFWTIMGGSCDLALDDVEK